VATDAETASRNDKKLGQNPGNGCADRRLLTQLQTKIEMNQVGGATGGEN